MSARLRKPATRLPPSLLLVAVILVGLSACTSGPVEPTASPTLTANRTAPSLGPTSTASPTGTTRAALTLTPTLAAIPTVSPAEPSRGPAGASVSLLVYSDFDCDLCAQTAATLEAIRQDHAQEVRYVFRPFPLLAAHERSAQAAAAALAAAEQGRFWEMHDHLFSQRRVWRVLTVPEFRTWLLETASQISVDGDQLAEDMTSATVLAAVEGAYRSAQASGVPGAPFLLVNGQPYLADLRQENLEAAVRLAALEPRQYERAPEVAANLESPRMVTMHFNLGDVRVQLYPQEAPRAVSSFLFLAEEGWYDGTILHRVVPGQLVEGGDPTATGLGDAGYHFGLETDPSLRFHRAGTLALANDGPGTNSARYFITLAPMPALNDSYTIFGRVLEGLPQFNGLQRREPIPDLLLPPQAVLEAITLPAPSP